MLDNVIWNALRTQHARFALGDERARRYPADVGPFLAAPRMGPAEVAALGELAATGETLTLTGVVPGSLPGWTIERVSAVSQMVWKGSANHPAGGEGVAALGWDDVPNMLALTALAFPAYFRSRTIALGSYFGIHHEGRLVAMAGQRFCLDGYREISAVCTHPDHRGQGHAGRLIALLVDLIRDEGLTPFLHVDAENSGARAAYGKLGFDWRSDLPLIRARRDAP